MRRMEPKVRRLPNRRMVIARALAGAALVAFAGCSTTNTTSTNTSTTNTSSGFYGTTPEPSQSREPDPAFARRVVTYPSPEPPGTIVVDPGSHFLYLVQGGGQAIRYGVGVGAEGFVWSGLATVHTKQEWPDWYPPPEMLARKPELREHMVQLQSGIGMKGGPENPIGARAMYLWQGKKDTLYRIHGTNEPWTIGTNVSSGCIRLTNDDVTDLYNRTPIGTKVIVIGTAKPAAAAQ
jgi:lipoprotein-anchoring transpeptidase ErfK/SrfK